MSLKSPMTPPGIDPGTVRLVVQRLNLYAAQAPYIYIYIYAYINFRAQRNFRIFMKVKNGSALTKLREEHAEKVRYGSFMDTADGFVFSII